MQRKSIYTKSLGDMVARGAKSSIGGKLHIVSSLTGKWALVSEGSVRPFRVFISQKAAVNFAKHYMNSGAATELVIHDVVGNIQSKVAI